MAKYTIELRDIIKLGYNIFDFPYDFYDLSKKTKFERNFIRHFYFREIGMNSVEEFKLYLQDKMETVFPYYNELFKANQIEYDILNSYRLTETTKVVRENEGKSSGVSSSVGNTYDTHSTTESGSHSTNGEANTDQSGSSTASNQGETHTTTDDTVSVTATESSESNTDTTGSNTKKYLETPSGKVNLDTVDYLTNVTKDESTSSADETRSGNSSSETETDGKTDVTTKSTDTSSSSSELNTTTSETGVNNSESTYEGEQKNTLNNNTRTNTNEYMTEEVTVSRVGNIGVSPDALDIMKHLELQKIMKSIENMFFDACEDLFMLVY